MRKDILLPSLSLAGGVAGFFLRRWQLASAYLPEEGLFRHGAPATWALLGLTAVLALAFLLLVQHKGGAEDFLSAFGSPETEQMTALAAAGLLLMIAGALGVKDGLAALQLRRAAPEFYPLSGPASQLVTGALCIPAGLGVLLMGRTAYRREPCDWACRMAPFPAFAALVWLFACHLKNGTEPVLMKYGFTMAAILFLTLTHYYTAGFFFDRPCRRRTLFLALTGALLGIISLADRPGLFTAFATLSFSLSALAFARVLLRNTFGPPWPKRLERRMPPSEEDSDDVSGDAPETNI